MLDSSLCIDVFPYILAFHFSIFSLGSSAITAHDYSANRNVRNVSIVYTVEVLPSDYQTWTIYSLRVTKNPTTKFKDNSRIFQGSFHDFQGCQNLTEIL